MNESVNDTRAALLAAGKELFARRGYDGASIRAITARAGANLGAVTYHFGSKRALYTAVLEAELAPIRDAVVAIAEGEGTALDRMCAVVAAYFRLLAEHPDLPRLLIQEIAAGRIPPDPVTGIFQTIAGALGRLQAEGERDGTVRPGDPLLTALSVLAQPVYMSLVAPVVSEVMGLPLTSGAHRDRLIRHATDFVRAGLTPPPETSS